MTEPLDPQVALVECVARLGLPQGSKASDVIQHVISTSGHYILLADILKIAHTLDASVNIYITDNEAVPTPFDL